MRDPSPSGESNQSESSQQLTNDDTKAADDNARLLLNNNNNNNKNNSGRPHVVNRTISSTSSTVSDGGGTTTTAATEPIMLVYHESARSIVFRDHMRRAVKNVQEGRQNGESTTSSSSSAAGATTTPTPTKRRTVTTEYVTELIDARRDTMEYQPPDDMIASKSKSNTNNNTNPSSTATATTTTTESNTESDSAFKRISNSFQPSIRPLPALPLGPKDELEELINSPTGRDGDIDPNWTKDEQHVVNLLGQQQAVVKTIKRTDWTAFLHRFQVPLKPKNSLPVHHDMPPRDGDLYPFTSFLTSCSLLPAYGQKMRSYGSATQYATGVVFALPQVHYSKTTTTTTTTTTDDAITTAAGDHHMMHGTTRIVSEDEAAVETSTWCFPSGYAAKTEFNRDSRGELINGRDKALVQLSVLREYNQDYVTKEDYMISGRIVKGGLKIVPYNEVFLRVGGLGRIVNEGSEDVATGDTQSDVPKTSGGRRSFDKGLGLPVALFSRSASYGHLISLIRVRARLMHVLGESQFKNIPLLLITPEIGVRVLTDKLQATLLKVASQRLNPFQNPTIAHKTTVDSTGEEQLEQKLEELIDLDDNVRKLLTPEECARLAGGFGATDDTVFAVLQDAMLADKKFQREHKDDQSAGESHMLQDIVNEGLAAAVRSGDYYASRQLLILYSLVASNGVEEPETNESKKAEPVNAEAKLLEEAPCVSELKDSLKTMGTNSKPPPPPPLDTDRLRSATNSDGLLSVLGAAQVLKSMQDGGAKKRTEEAILALDEWIEYGENSMAFRLASWRDQRSAQGDLKIAMDSDSSFMAFLSNKAVSNRKAFVSQLKQTVESSDFCDAKFLSALEGILSRMHSPCLRLELLQYVLGLDNRYSIAHVARSVELAKTCLGH